MSTQSVKDAVRHRAPRVTAAVLGIRQRLRNRSSPYAVLDRAHRVSGLLGPDVEIHIDRGGVWLRDAKGCFWRHVPGVYGPFLGLEQGRGFETAELHWAASTLRPGSVLIDVGANIGVFSINVMLCSENTSALAIEPVGTTHSCLRANITRNGLSSRVRAVRAAVGEGEGQAVVTSGLHAANHIVPGHRPKASAAEERVRQTSLDMLVSEHCLKRVDLVKIDVEGFELSVLNGAKKTLHQLRPTVLMEIEARWTRRYGYAPQAIIDLMCSFGYTRYVFADCLRPSSGNLEADLASANNFVFIHEQPVTGQGAAAGNIYRPCKDAGS